MSNEQAPRGPSIPRLREDDYTAEQAAAMRREFLRQLNRARSWIMSVRSRWTRGRCQGTSRTSWVWRRSRWAWPARC